MEDFGGGKGEPDESVDEDENAENAPNEDARAIKWRRNPAASGGARTLSCPAVPEAAETDGNFCGREQNHHADAENCGADEILDKRVTHGARI